MSKNTGQSTSIMESRTISGLKGLAVIGSVLVYLLIVVYAEYHFFNLISGFVPGGMQVVGMIAVAASGITAILLPVAIHFWFRSGLQLIVGFIFYGIHFLMMFANLILDSSLQGTATADTPDWIVTVYAPYILPGYIAFYALAWSILWFVDSNSQRIDKRREVEQIEEDGRLDRQISLANFRSNALTAAFNSQAAQETVNRLIATQAPALLAQELGLSVEELGPTQDFEFWMRPAQANQPSQASNKNIVAADGPPAPTTRPRDYADTQTAPPPARPSGIARTRQRPDHPPRRAQPGISVSLNDFLATSGMTAEEARDQLEHHSLTTPQRAYDVMRRSGVIPGDMTREEFDPLFHELIGNGVQKDSPLSPTGTRPE